MNSWRKQRNVCLFNLGLIFALAACDSEPERKDTEATQPPAAITETAEQPQSPLPPETAMPEPSSGSTRPESVAGGESAPPQEAPAEPPEVAQAPPEQEPAVQPPPPEPAPDLSEAVSPLPVEAAPAPPPSVQETPPVRPPVRTAVPRKPERITAADKPVKPVSVPRKPTPVKVSVPPANPAASPIRNAVAVAPVERLASDPSVVPSVARTIVQPDVSQMLFKIQEIHFNPGSSDLTPGGQRKTLTASRFIGGLQVRSIKVVGYADTVGTPDFNRELALARAGSVASLLRQTGVPAGLIQTIGMGESTMPMQTDDGISEPLNRCVGILVSVDDSTTGTR
jgi:outer membrane protein OmpA-like peptidoglycan-associated protein